VTNYYVYYRVDARKMDALRVSVPAMFKAIERQTGIAGRWMHRRDDAQTCMEVYEGVLDEAAFETILERESATLDLQRNLERFVCA